MNRTTPPRSAKLSRSSAETTDPTADELRRNEGTGAGPASRARGQAPRYRAPDSLIDFLMTLKLCGARNRRLPLQAGGWRTTPAVATH